MAPDTIFVIGLALIVLAIPAVISALARERLPRGGAVLVVIGGAMAVYAMTQNPGAYTLETLPAVVMQVFGGGEA